MHDVISAKNVMNIIWINILLYDILNNLFKISYNSILIHIHLRLSLISQTCCSVFFTVMSIIILFLAMLFKKGFSLFYAIVDNMDI